MRETILVLVAVSVLAGGAFASNSKSLFKIERNKNANIVKYDVNFSEDGKIDEENPIDSYWVMHADKGQREEVAPFEKRAYGYSVKYNKDGWYDLRLRAVSGRPLKIVDIDGEPKAEILINGENAYLSKVYVFAKDGLLGVPKVSYYTLTGIAVDSGEEISEKIDVDKNAGDKGDK